jgi:Protein of unknown function (DUF3072)
MKHETTNPSPQPAVQRDPDEWKTGDEPMTDAQRSYLDTLCRETGEELDDTLTKAEASKRIDELRGRSPRLADSKDVDPDSAESEVDRDDTSDED